MTGLAEVLGEHVWSDEYGCECAAAIHFDEWSAHVAAAVTAWLAERLGGDEVREAVAEVLSCGATGEMTAYSETAHPDHNRWSWRGEGHAPAIREQYRADADAALDRRAGGAGPGRCL